MKRIGLLIVAVVVAFFWLGIGGCKKDEPPKKTTVEKLNSDNPDEQKEGLDEANRKYGGGK
ncbi:MAG TPA: hypothetical protein PLP01_10030 [Phycisphaerae bacterium]|nr:hypothetical protein [Phycisphaerae bacterium]